MADIRRAFDHGKAFIGFLTGGDPSLEMTEEFVMEMVRAGANMVEIGIPFSDPIAEGPVIQEASARALSAGTNVDGLFDLVESLRRKTDVPLAFMTYLNPVFRYGYEEFMLRCQQTGVDALIIPDLPFEESDEVSMVMERYGIDLISMISPTSGDRIPRIAEKARGFLYVVSSMGVTGIREQINNDVEMMISTARSVTNVPLAVGFGINSPEQARNMAEVADGVIVGSAIVRIVSEHGVASAPYIYDFVKSMKDAIQTPEEGGS